MERRQDPQELFLSRLDEIEDAVRFVARRARLRPEDADDLSASLKLRLIENDYAILRRFGGRCSLRTYVASIAHRLCADEWMRVHGRWRPSAEARRRGDAAVLLEGLIVRDGRSLEDALPVVQGLDASFTRQEAEEIVARLPERNVRLKIVSLDDSEQLVARRVIAEDPGAGIEHAATNETASRIVRETLRSMTAEDRAVLRLRFANEMRVSDIGRMLGCEQRPLYRRIESLVRKLHDALVDAGIDGVAVQTLIGAPASDLDFGWRDAEVQR